VSDKYGFADAEYATGAAAPGITQMCEWLGVSKSGFYEWRSRPESATAERRNRLALIIKSIFDDSDSTYGYRRIATELARQGIVAGLELVRKLMRATGLEGLPARKKGRRNLVGVATHEDLVNRNFIAASPNRIWLTDVTEHNTREGTLYCCAVLDLFSRRVVGWAIDRRNDAVLVNDALLMAARSRATSPETILHSDHGSGFISWSFTQNLRSHKLLGSMGTVGDCFDCEDPLAAGVQLEGSSSSLLLTV